MVVMTVDARDRSDCSLNRAGREMYMGLDLQASGTDWHHAQILEPDVKAMAPLLPLTSRVVVQDIARD